MRTQPGLISKVCEGLRVRSLVDVEGSPAVLMVSGGSDSVAMARIMAMCSRQIGLSMLRIMHVNHNLRGAESDGDEEFVRALGEELGIEVTVFSEDIPSLVQSLGGNMEDLARKVRYARASHLLDGLCDELGVSRERGRIVVAHTADDRVETFFMRSIVGAGLSSLCAINHRNGRVIRPLLDFSREELRTWLRVNAQSGQLWREDSTNSDEDRFRAFVRHRIVPLAKQRNPSLNETLCRNLDLLSSENALLDEMAQEVQAEAVELRLGQEGFSHSVAVIDTKALSKAPVPIRRRVVRNVLLSALLEGTRLDSDHIERIVQEGSRHGFCELLPSGFLARTEYGSILVGHPAKAAQQPEAVLSVPGSVSLADGRAFQASLCQVCDVAGLARAAGPKSVFVDIGDAEGLRITTPSPGQRMQPFGMAGHSKKVADILKDAKVPARLRANAALVVLEGTGEPVWLVGHCIDNRHRITSATCRVARLDVSTAL